MGDLNRKNQEGYEEYLAGLDAQHLRRHLRVFDSPSGPVMTHQGRSFINFASNNYLGLNTHPAIKESAIEAINSFGVGSGASRLISGTLLPHQELEMALAQFKQTEAALTFSSGYAANSGIIPAMVGTQGQIFVDRLCHASVIDGCRLSRARLRVFQHNDPDHLRIQLAKRPANRPTLVVTEGVFSMDGDIAPLSELMEVAQHYEAALLVDDAHGTGVMGKHGRGTVEHFGIDPSGVFQMGTLSKALGTVGGYVVGSRPFIEYLINICRSFIYTTAPPPAFAAAARTALEIVQSDPGRRSTLWQNRNRLFQGLSGMGFTLTNTQSPILPVILNRPALALEMSKKLFNQGIYVPAIRPPTVPKGTSRLRVTVTSDHTPEHLDTALETFKKVGQELGII
ncbi:MAG: 8-amino-7-oxononanoate synthase [Nitrospirota bacterium]|nr:MAG: 8-amino-7-oxononanoate synthase [Nitrospirota bacterium]